MPTQRITLDPEPPAQGKDVEICYDFAGSGLASTTLSVSFDGGEPDDLAVTPEDPCVVVGVPDNATRIVVADASGVSPNKTSAITPT